MTGPSERDEIAAVLAAHEIDLGGVRRDRESPAGYWMACACGYEWSPSPDNDHHRTHLAAVLAERDRRTAAKTLREAADEDDADRPAIERGRYHIGYCEMVDGYRHAYEAPVGKRGYRTVVRYSRSANHPPDPRCPECHPIEEPQ